MTSDIPQSPTLDPMPRRDIVPPFVPTPQSKQHAEAMLYVAQKYLDGDPV